MPHRPLTPWTLMAPTGSSMPRFSQKKTLQMTSTPAMAPIRNAAHGVTKAHGAVMATRPASMPLHIIEGSGLPKTIHMYRHEASAPAAEASIVLTAMMPMRLSDAASEEPALNPNQPKARM